MTPFYDAETYEKAIAQAVAASDLSAAVSLLRSFAVAHPYRAEKCLNAIESVLDALKESEEGQA